MNLKSLSSTESFGSFRNPSGPLVFEEEDEVFELGALFEVDEPRVLGAGTEATVPRAGAPPAYPPVGLGRRAGRQVQAQPCPRPGSPARPAGSRAVTSTSVMRT